MLISKFLADIARNRRYVMVFVRFFMVFKPYHQHFRRYMECWLYRLQIFRHKLWYFAISHGILYYCLNHTKPTNDLVWWYWILYGIAVERTEECVKLGILSFDLILCSFLSSPHSIHSADLLYISFMSSFLSKSSHMYFCPKKWQNSQLILCVLHVKLKLGKLLDIYVEWVSDDTNSSVLGR